MNIKVLGVSGGNGVLLFPFRKYLVANIEIRSAFQTENDAQWKLNFPKSELIKEREYKRDGFKDYGKIDVILGHPNCGAGSILRLAKSKAYTSSRGDLSIELFFNSINHYKPRFFLFENLVAIFKSYSKAELREIFTGYRLIFHSGPVAKWGNSQLGRKRLVIVGIREDQNIPARAFSLPKQENMLLSNCKALEKLLASQLEHQNAEQLFHLREADSTVMHMERNWKRLTLKEIRDEWNKPENQRTKSWNAETHGKGRMKTLPGVYRNRPEDFPRAVLRNNRQFDPKGNIMSPRQLANIQGIATEFKLYYNPNKLGYCLNKARVTIAKSPPMEIGNWFYRKIKKANKDDTVIKKIRTIPKRTHGLTLGT
jgi:site-specific DNA-cytosine methylase